MALTAEQQALLDAIAARLSGDPEIEAAWLGGSLGRGAGDAFSDVDVVALVAEGHAGRIGQRYVRDVALIAEPALVTPLFGARVVSVVTTDWRRFDLTLIEPGELARYDAARLTALFNKGDRVPPIAAAAAPYSPSPATVLALVNEFLRVLGLLVVAVGREEWLLALSGMDILRRLTIDLMLEENAVAPADRGGALRRNPLLTSDQRRELEALSPVAATRASVIAANAELAAVFLPRARRVAERVGMAWPTVFEAATRRHLQQRLGMVIEG
jgi:predicted nucleotidyltransferase